MTTIQIEDMQLAAALLREPSLSAAARALDVTPPALSMRLRKLEAALGLSLATRTARKLSLTPEGERFAREAAALLGQIEGLRESMQRDDKRLTGTLRIAAPSATAGSTSRRCWLASPGCIRGWVCSSTCARPRGPTGTMPTR